MPNANPCRIESLEGRRLLAATLIDGTLVVTGTAKDDGIVVLVHGDGHLHVELNGKESTFEQADVKRVIINCGGGNDIVDATTMVIPVAAYGGNGNDSIYAGNGNDDVHGGAGDDILWTTGGRDRVYGDDGNDALAGGGSNDTLSGDAGDDRMDGGNGNDDIAGGDGTDRCNGQLGDDSLSGGGGRDFFAGGAGHDTFEDYSTKDRGNDRGSDETGPDDRGTDDQSTSDGDLASTVTGGSGGVTGPISIGSGGYPISDGDTLPGTSNGD